MFEGQKMVTISQVADAFSRSHEPADGVGIQIDSGVPIPRVSGAGRPKSEHRRALEIMQVGQSFMFDDGVRGAVLKASGTVSRVMKRKFTARRYQGGSRIWRVA